MSRKFWTPDELERLTREYPDSHTPTLARELGRPLQSVYSKALSLGLRKSEAYLAGPLAGRTDGKRGGSTRFQRGLQPWNKGSKGISGIHENTRRTQFRKGNVPDNYVPIGTLRLSKDGYLERKVTDDPALVPARRWTAVHRLVWEAANGPIPPATSFAFCPGGAHPSSKRSRSTRSSS